MNNANERVEAVESAVLNLGRESERSRIQLDNVASLLQQVLRNQLGVTRPPSSNSDPAYSPFAGVRAAAATAAAALPHTLITQIARHHKIKAKVWILASADRKMLQLVRA
jgi:hypothetical protein